MNFFSCINNDALTPGFQQFLHGLKTIMLTQDGMQDDLLIRMLESSRNERNVTDSYLQKAYPSHLFTLGFLIDKDRGSLGVSSSIEDLLSRITNITNFQSIDLKSSAIKLIDACLHLEIRLDRFSHSYYYDLAGSNKIINLVERFKIESLQRYFALSASTCHFFKGCKLILPPHVEKIVSQSFIDQPLEEKIQSVRQFLSESNLDNMRSIYEICEFARNYYHGSISKGQDVATTIKKTSEILAAAIHEHPGETARRHFIEEALVIFTLEFPNLFKTLYPDMVNKEFFSKHFSIIDAPFESFFQSLKNSPGGLNWLKKKLVTAHYNADTYSYRAPSRHPIKQILNAYDITDFDAYPTSSEVLAAFCAYPEEFSEVEIAHLLSSDYSADKPLIYKSADAYFSRHTIDPEQSKRIVDMLFRVDNTPLFIHGMKRSPEAMERFAEHVMELTHLPENYLDRIRPIHDLLKKNISKIKNPKLKKQLLSADIELL